MAKVFQYGSNCDRERLNSSSRLGGAACPLGKAQTVDNYEISFDVWSHTNNCAAAGLIRRGNTPAWGALYEIPEEFIDGPRRQDGRRTLKEIEGVKYEQHRINVIAEGQTHSAVTFLVRKSERVSGKPTASAYVSHIVKGLRENCVPEEYIDRVIEVALENLDSSERYVSAERARIEELRKARA